MNRLRGLTQRIWESNVDEGRIGSLELNAFLAQLMGLPLSGFFPQSKKQRFRVLATSCLVLPCLFLYVSLETYDLVLNWTDVDVVTQNVLSTLLHVGYWFKVLNTFYHYTEIKDIVIQLRFLTRTCVISPQQRDTFHRLEAEGKLVCLIYFCLVVFSSGMAMVMLLIVPDAMAGKRFPFRVHVPSQLPTLVSHLYMGLSTIWISCGIPTIDNVNVLLMNQICLHLKVLNLAFEVLQPDPEGRLPVEPYEWMLSIVQYHCHLIGLRQRMERIYHLPVMFQFASSLLLVAMTVFQTLVGDGSNSSVLIYFMLSGVLCQIFLYCWFGNEVYEQSKKLSTSGFGCDWLQCDKRFRSSLLIFMLNADRPLLFTAGGFMGLTLTSFANILSKSYSVVAVLRQMYAKDQA
ncbi:hypothetical protein KR009_007802 [Drosophila setifemur]|nr:hypothetical protein KR009_007802 [Drosophila setifemur]